MDLELSVEQAQLRDSISIAFRRAVESSEALGPMLAELGAVSMLVPQEQGGMGLGMVEGVIACTQAGRFCLNFPLAETILLTGALTSVRPEAGKRVLSGLSSITAACDTRREGQEHRNSGGYSAAYLDSAEWFAVLREDGDIAFVEVSRLGQMSRNDLEPGIATGLVGVEPVQDSTAVVSMDLAVERLAILRSAEIVGAAAFCFETAIEYLKDRRQFGQPIGANQALKHIAADGYVQLENIRVAIDYAATAIDRAVDNPGEFEWREEAQQVVSVVLSFVPTAARELAEMAIQFHGGIGVTWEYPLNRYLRRILRIGQSLGSSEDHRRTLVNRMVASDAEPRWQEQSVEKRPA